VNEEMIKDAFIGVSKKKIIDEAGGAVSYVDAFVGKLDNLEFIPVNTQGKGASEWRTRGAFVYQDHADQVKESGFLRRSHNFPVLPGMIEFEPRGLAIFQVVHRLVPVAK